MTGDLSPCPTGKRYEVARTPGPPLDTFMSEPICAPILPDATADPRTLMPT